MRGNVVSSWYGLTLTQVSEICIIISSTVNGCPGVLIRSRYNMSPVMAVSDTNITTSPCCDEVGIHIAWNNGIRVRSRSADYRGDD